MQHNSFRTIIPSCNDDFESPFKNKYRILEKNQVTGSIVNLIQKESSIPKRESGKKGFGNRLFKGSDIFQPEVWMNKERKASVDISTIKEKNEYAGVRYGNTNEEVKFYNETCFL
jgi:hypothetical protein